MQKHFFPLSLVLLSQDRVKDIIAAATAQGGDDSDEEEEEEEALEWEIAAGRESEYWIGKEGEQGEDEEGDMMGFSLNASAMEWAAVGSPIE